MNGDNHLPRASADDSGCPEELRDLFRSARRDDPEPAQVDKLWQALQPIVGGPVGGPEGGPPGDGPGAGPAAPAAAGAGQAVAGHSAASLVRFALGGAGATALIIVTGTVWMSRSESTMQPATTPLTSTVVYLASHGPASSSAPRTEPIIGDAGSERPVQRRLATRAPAPPGTESVPPESEAQLLKRAHLELRQGSAARALTLTQEHQRNYPRALLSQERELIAVEALVALGRRDEALARSRAFLDRYPHSAHARRLRTILGIDADERKDPGNVIIADAGAHSPVERLEPGDAGR